MDFRVKYAEDKRELNLLRKFMMRQPQFYPDYLNWVDGVCIPGIESGNRKAIVVISNGIVVGDAVWKELPDYAEVKNFRIDAEYERRDLGRFLLTQAAREAGKPLRLDVSVSNFAGVRFFILNGFRIEGLSEIYSEGQLEYLMGRAA